MNNNYFIKGVTFGDTTKTISSPTRSIQNMATFEEMQLMSKPIFILGTDNVSFNVVLGSDNGRIFLGGRDGCLYEVSYQAESSWFGKRCKKVNHSQGIVSYMVPSFLKVFSVCVYYLFILKYFKFYLNKNEWSKSQEIIYYQYGRIGLSKIYYTTYTYYMLIHLFRL